MKNLIDDINRLISLNLLEEGFVKFDALKIPQEFRNNLVILKSRYKQNERDKQVLGISDNDSYSVTRDEIKVGLQKITNDVLEYITCIEEKYYAIIDKQFNPNLTNSNFTIIVSYKGDTRILNFISTWWKKKIFIDKELVNEKIGIFSPVQKLDFSIPFKQEIVPARLVVIFDFFWGGINKIKFFLDEIKILETGVEVKS